MSSVEFDILLVEDDPMTRLIMRSLLQESGYRVREVDEGHLAVTTLQEEGADLVVLDYYLPDMNGSDVLKALGRLLEKMPVIVVTGYDDPRLAEGVLEAGASRFVHKDSDCKYLRELPEIVAETLAQKKLTQNKSISH